MQNRQLRGLHIISDSLALSQGMQLVQY